MDSPVSEAEEIGDDIITAAETAEATSGRPVFLAVTGGALLVVIALLVILGLRRKKQKPV